MSARSLVFAAAFSLAVGFGASMPARAQESGVQAPEVANARFQFQGVINANGVYVRSGPSQNYYATGRVDHGTHVTVVGIKGEWLKIVPPEGSFSVVGKTTVDKQPDGATGIINGDNVNVRAGSSLFQLKATVQCKMNKGSTVTIIGDDDAYYRIKPPADAYVYVHQRYVDPLRPQTAAATTRPSGEGVGPVGGVPSTQPTESGVAIVGPRNGGTPATQPSHPRNHNRDTIAVAPPTQEDEAARELARREKAEAEFERLEAEVKDLPQKDLEQQPLAQLLASYEKLLANNYLPVSMRRMADLRTASLRIKLKGQQDYLAVKKQQDASNARLAVLAQQQAEMESRFGKIEIYTAVGQLQASAMQNESGHSLFRLTDPSTGRSLCYVRSNEPTYVKLIGQFVGVKGDMESDPQLTLKVVTATETKEVDPTRIGKGVSAQIVPPSILTGQAFKTQTPKTDKTDNTASTNE